MQRWNIDEGFLEKNQLKESKVPYIKNFPGRNSCPTLKEIYGHKQKESQEMEKTEQQKQIIIIKNTYG